MCQLCTEGFRRIGSIDRRDALRILAAAGVDPDRPSLDEDPHYQPFGVPADSYAIALGRPITTPIVKDRSGTPDGYRTALTRRKAAYRVG